MCSVNKILLCIFECYFISYTVIYSFVEFESLKDWLILPLLWNCVLFISMGMMMFFAWMLFSFFLSNSMPFVFAQFCHNHMVAHGFVALLSAWKYVLSRIFFSYFFRRHIFYASHFYLESTSFLWHRFLMEWLIFCLIFMFCALGISHFS